MRIRNLIKVIAILLAIASMVTILSGCGNASNTTSASSKDEIKFRDIPFGTKYADVMPAIKEDLKGQGYNREPEVYEREDSNTVYVEYDGVKLFDFDVREMALEFLKEDDENIDDAELIDAGYVILFDKENEEKECYAFLDGKLTELYGKKTKFVSYGEERDGWVKGNTCCYIIEKLGSQIIIVYGFTNFDELSENSVKAEEARKVESANKGL